MSEDLPPPDKDLESKAPWRDPHPDWHRQAGGAYEEWKQDRQTSPVASWIGCVVTLAVVIIIVVVIVALIRVLT